MTTRDATTLAFAGASLCAFAFVVGAAVASRARRWGALFGYDFPGGPLRHRIGVPLAGGVALWTATLATFALAALTCLLARPILPEVVVRYIDGMWSRANEVAAILGLATLVLIAGLTADLFDLGWKPRLASQTMIAAALAVMGVRVTLFWPLTHPAIGGLVATLWIVGLINAFAFLDNMDGLAAGIGLIASLLFAATQAQIGGLFAPAARLVFAGALGGVLVYNRYPAPLFLGQGGSWLIGFVLAAMTIAGTYYRYGVEESRNSVLSPLLVMAVPFYESAVVFLVWLGERRSPFLRNPRHFSYRLGEVGLSPAQSVRLLLLVSVGAGLGSLLLRRLDAFGTIVLLAQVGCLIAVVSLVEASAICRKRSVAADDEVRPDRHE